MDLLVVGDANPDLIVRGGDVVPAFGQREQLVDEAALVLGGSGAIMACGASRLGLRVGMAACVGDDALGRFTVGELAAAGVDVEAVQVLEGVPTGVTVALARDDDRAMLTARGALAASTPAAVPDALLARARHVHVASPFLQPRLRDGLSEFVARVHGLGASVSLDPGWDPDELWSLAVGAVDVLLPNTQEAVRLAWRAGGRARTVRRPPTSPPTGARAFAVAAGPARGGQARRGGRGRVLGCGRRDGRRARGGGRRLDGRR